MNGQRHYRHSEKLAAIAGKYLQNEGLSASVANMIALAQVHATLAVAAATAGAADAWADVLDDSGPEIPPPPGLLPRQTPRPPRH
jgi:hypothetical protein